MLWTYGSDNTMVRMNNIADFLDIPHMSGSHFTHKDLMGAF